METPRPLALGVTWGCSGDAYERLDFVLDRLGKVPAWADYVVRFKIELVEMGRRLIV
ncbi:MAG: hypothetical protein HPY71_06285 [Firmicutes bacterium]|nr:hypothetical protein [Bacillota bacterium]